MRLLLANYELPPIGGGAGNATAFIARELAAQGHAVVVLTARYQALPREEWRDGYHVVRVPALRRRADRSTPAEMLSFLLGGLGPTLALGRAWRPDAAVAFFGVPTGPLLLALRTALGVPYLVSLRGGDVPGFLGAETARLHALARPLIQQVWRYSAGLVANSDGLADLARRTWPEAPLVVVPNGVDTRLFQPRRAARAGAEDSRAPGPPRLLCVGRLVAQKDLPTVIRAVAAARSAPALRLVGDGPDRAALEALARRLGVAQRVTFSGWAERSALADHYAGADLFVSASREEGMPNVVLEALASGLPVVASDVYGHRGLVEPGVNGLLVPAGDAPALAAAVDRLAEDAALRARLAEGARHSILAHGWDGVARQYATLLARAAAGRPIVETPTVPGRHAR